MRWPSVASRTSARPNADRRKIMERWAKFLSGDDTSNVVPMKRGGVIKLAISVEAFEAIAPTLRDEAEPNGRMADRLAAFARAG